MLELQLHDVKGTEDSAVVRCDVTQEDVPELAGGSHPAQPGDGIGVSRHTGYTNTTMHFGHS
jgi:hypothetical protein